LFLPNVKITRWIDDTENMHQSLNRRAWYLSTFIDKFSLRCRKDYLLSLRENHNLSVKKKSIANGDVVIVQREGIMIPRLIWKLGRAESLGKSNDGKVRGAVVKIEKETGTSRCSDRPITS
jgi:hypothetical protein